MLSTEDFDILQSIEQVLEDCVRVGGVGDFRHKAIAFDHIDVSLGEALDVPQKVVSSISRQEAVLQLTEMLGKGRLGLLMASRLAGSETNENFQQFG